MKKHKTVILRIERILKLSIILLLLPIYVSCGTGTASEQNASDQQIEKDDGVKTYNELVVGYSQIGAESEWRTGNTASIKEAAAELGVELLFSDAQQKQENQIKEKASSVQEEVMKELKEKKKD